MSSKRVQFLFYYFELKVRIWKYVYWKLNKCSRFTIDFNKRTPWARKLFKDSKICLFELYIVTHQKLLFSNLNFCKKPVKRGLKFNEYCLCYVKTHWNGHFTVLIKKSTYSISLFSTVFLLMYCFLDIMGVVDAFICRVHKIYQLKSLFRGLF